MANPSLFDRAEALFGRVRSAIDAFRADPTAAPGVTYAPGVPAPQMQVPAQTTPVEPTGDQSGLPASLTVQGAGPSPVVDKYPLISGPLMNPAVVSAALRLGERGYMRRLSDLLSELRETTPHLQATLSKREKAVAGVGWTISPAETKGLSKRDAKLADKYADYARQRTAAIPQFGDALEHLQGAVYFGRSACEIEWARDARGIYPARLHSVHPKRLSYAANWRIHLYDEAGNEQRPELGYYPGLDIRATWPDRFIIHEPRTMGAELPTRQGLGRVLVWAGMFWKWTTRDWMTFAELFAKPWRVGYYPKGAQKEDIAALKAGLLQLSGMTTAVFPEGCKPMFVEPGRGSNGIHGDLVALWNAEISKVVAGGTLQTEIKGDSGNRALGEVMERGEQRLVASDGRALSETGGRDLIRVLTRLQFGDEAATRLCPIFALSTDPPVDKDKAAARVQAFVDRGGAIDADEYRDKYCDGMRKPAPGAPLLQPMGKVVAISSTAGEGDQPTKPTDEAPDTKPTDDKPNEDVEDDDNGGDDGDSGEGEGDGSEGGDAGGGD